MSQGKWFVSITWEKPLANKQLFAVWKGKNQAAWNMAQFPTSSDVVTNSEAVGTPSLRWQPVKQRKKNRDCGRLFRLNHRLIGRPHRTIRAHTQLKCRLLKGRCLEKWHSDVTVIYSYVSGNRVLNAIQHHSSPNSNTAVSGWCRYLFEHVHASFPIKNTSFKHIAKLRYGKDKWPYTASSLGKWGHYHWPQI